MQHLTQPFLAYVYAIPLKVVSHCAVAYVCTLIAEVELYRTNRLGLMERFEGTVKLYQGVQDNETSLTSSWRL